MKLLIGFFEFLEEDWQLLFGEEAGGYTKMMAGLRLAKSAARHQGGSSILLYLLTVELVHWPPQSLSRSDSLS